MWTESRSGLGELARRCAGGDQYLYAVKRQRFIHFLHNYFLLKRNLVHVVS